MSSEEEAAEATAAVRAMVAIVENCIVNILMGMSGRVSMMKFSLAGILEYKIKETTMKRIRIWRTFHVCKLLRIYILI